MKKAILITGASGGIGQAVATNLVESYSPIYLHYNKNLKAVQQIREKLLQFGAEEVYLVQANFAEKDGVDLALQQIHDPIHTVIHNSGASHFGLITDWKSEEAEKFIQLHVTSPFLLTKALLPNMISSKEGNIIFITSIWGITGASCEVLYSMVKGSQNSFVKALAKEVARSGISVNAVAPGAVDTNMLANFTITEKEEIAEEIPAGRLGEPEEVANLVSFLLSKKASYINGQIISINGAWHC
jgi:3-oxoacyl-[acyl-carrier protein] reductase